MQVVGSAVHIHVVDHARVARYTHGTAERLHLNEIDKILIE